jgi:hypothetical protein
MNDKYEEPVKELSDKSFSNWMTTHALICEENGEIDRNMTIVLSGVIFSSLFALGIMGAMAATETSDVKIGYAMWLCVLFGALGLSAGWLWVLEIDIADSVFPRAVLGPYLFPLGFAASALVALRNGATSDLPAEEVFLDAITNGLINAVFFLLVALLIDKLRLKLNNTKRFDPQSRTFDDPFILIERLGILRDRGLLTDEEFESKKHDILKSI